MRDVGVHPQVAGEVYHLVMEVECSGKIRLCAGDPEGEVFTGGYAVLNPCRTFQRGKGVRWRLGGIGILFALGAVTEIGEALFSFLVGHTLRGNLEYAVDM